MSHNIETHHYTERSGISLSAGTGTVTKLLFSHFQVRRYESSQLVLSTGGEASSARTDPLSSCLQCPLRDPDGARGTGYSLSEALGAGASFPVGESK